MKEKICIGIVGVAAVIQVLLLVGLIIIPKYKPTNDKPDDAISQAIYDIVGDEIYYQGKEERSSSVLYYEYLIRDTNEHKSDYLDDLVIAVNETIIKKNITNKVDIVFFHELPGGSGQCIELENYSDYKLEYPDCEGLQTLTITGFSRHCEECIYDEPSIYMNLPNIKYLKVSEQVQKKADEQDIDWYALWPSLESLEVYGRGESFKSKRPDDAISQNVYQAVNSNAFYLGKSEDEETAEVYYKYYIRDKDKDVSEISDIVGAIVTAVNKAIKEENITDLVSINIYQCDEQGKEALVLSLGNYSDFRLDYADFEGMEVARIYGSDYEEHPYNCPETYISLPNIKYLYINRNIQKAAKKQGIDWYDYWPDLEKIVVS